MSKDYVGMDIYSEEFAQAQLEKNIQMREKLNVMSIKETKMTDFTKPVQTRSGLPVTIITTEGRGVYPIIGYVDDSTLPAGWSKDGRDGAHYSDYSYDLINIPEKRVMLIHFYIEDDGNVFPSEKSSSKFACKKIASRRVEYTEGQFDE